MTFSLPDLSEREQEVLGVLRAADESWVELWQIAKRGGLSIHQAGAAVRGLRARGLVVKRPCRNPLTRVEVSLRRSGL